MQILGLSEPACFEQLASEWHELLDQAAVNHVFITPEFQSVWWKCFGQGELHVVTFRDDTGKLVGLAPLQKNGDELSFIGNKDLCDYLDFIVDKEVEEQIYAELTEYLKKFSKVMLLSVPHNSPTRKYLADVFGPQLNEQQQDVCPVIPLPKTWEEYLTLLGKKQRHEIKRKWQKLEQEVLATFTLVDNQQLAEKDILDFIALHQHSSQEKKEFWDDKHMEFFTLLLTKVAEKGWLQLFFLEIKGERVATMLGFAYRNELFLYNSGFSADEYRQLSVGNVLTSFTIKYAIEAGFIRYDFLRGDEEYKFRYGAQAEPVFDLTLQF
jgi:CelD/BcsL family acetyltransferase involved in cellulose biosynthesis